MEFDWIQHTFENIPPLSQEAQNATEALLRFSGFPEPFFRHDERFLARWRMSYATRLVREDIRDLFRFSDLDRIELLNERLSQNVASSLKYKALSEDLEVASETIERWVSALERLYGLFRIAPVGPPKIRAVRKEQKLYFWDWTRAATHASSTIPSSTALSYRVHRTQEKSGDTIGAGRSSGLSVLSKCIRRRLFQRLRVFHARSKEPEEGRLHSAPVLEVTARLLHQVVLRERGACDT